MVPCHKNLSIPSRPPRFPRLWERDRMYQIPRHSSFHIACRRRPWYQSAHLRIGQQKGGLCLLQQSGWVDNDCSVGPPAIHYVTWTAKAMLTAMTDRGRESMMMAQHGFVQPPHFKWHIWTLDKHKSCMFTLSFISGLNFSSCQERYSKYHV